MVNKEEQIDDLSVTKQANNRVRSLSSREVEGNGPMKPGNPLVPDRKGANSGG